MTDKQALRAELRARRREHADSLPEAVRALVLMRPPRPVADLIPAGASVGLYHAMGGEAPTGGYARWLFEAGHPIALPWFADRTAPMRFRQWDNPHVDDLLEAAPWGSVQPRGDAAELVPDVLIVPLVGFTARGQRLGQGGGHYDRYLAQHPHILPIGLAWDCQLVDELPVEPHDIALKGVVTPTRFYGPF